MDLYDTKITLSIMVCLICALGGTAYLIYTPDLTDWFRFVVVICISVSTVIALGLIAGYYARYLGFTKEELDKMGDDAIEGKPPL